MIYSELAENTVIGALMQVSSPAEWLAGLCEEDFVQELNRAALSAMHRLCARREPIDIRTVGYEMRRDERAKDEGKAQAHLIGCFRACPAPSGVQGYVKRIKELSARRMLQRVAERLAASAADEGLPPDETAEEANGEILELVCNLDDMTPEALSFACARLADYHYGCAGPAFGIRGRGQVLPASFSSCPSQSAHR